jgi:imidazolonepropionase-like amidohydrolase
VADLGRPDKQAAMRGSRAAQAYKQALVVARRNLKRAADAGLFVVMGTDTGPFPERFQGFFEHVELSMMVESGLTPAQALRSATTDAARALRLEGLGTLSPGAWADFVVLDRDPLADIRNSRTIHSVYVAGNRVQ